jgi:hypothetical protein
LEALETSQSFNISIINTTHGIKEPTFGYQNYNTAQILVFGGHVKVRESLCTQVIIWVSIIPNHINTMAILPRYEYSCMIYINSNGVEDKNVAKYPYHAGIKKCEIRNLGFSICWEASNFQHLCCTYAMGEDYLVLHHSHLPD